MGVFAIFLFYLALETIKSVQGQLKNNFFNIALQGQQQKKPKQNKTHMVHTW